MKRSSIFSREYEKKIRRRRFTILFIILLLSIMIVYYIINFSQFNSYVKNIYYSAISKNDTIVSLQQDEQDVQDFKNDEGKDNSSEDEIFKEYEDAGNTLTYELQLNEDTRVNILYENTDGIRYLDFQTELPENYKFDISPSKNRILIEEVNAQDVYLVDENLNSFKLDPEFFYSNSANTSFYKNNVLSNYEGYIWYKNAKFLDDNTIVYVSNLPWFGREEQYVWRTDISDLQNIRHFMTSTGGQNIDFGELTEEGIKVNINNEIKLLTFSFILN